ncbi:MAG: SpoIIE family protein phosphatase [Leptospirales bacterium]|nr:SpoIIE family protein phosphatase [Leptospirales bacterium]
MDAPDAQASHAFRPLFEPVSGGRLAVRRLPEVLEILDLALMELTRMVQARRGNFYFFSENGDLLPHRKGDDTPALRALAETALQSRASLLYGPAGLSGLRLKQEAPANFALAAPSMCGYLSLQEGDLGVVALSEPIYLDQFFEADFNLIKGFAATFAILLRNGVTGRTPREIFLSFKSSLLLLQENTHLLQRIKESDYRLNTVLEVSNQINSSRELKELVEAVLYSARRVLRAQSASLFLMDRATGELYFDIVAGQGHDELQGMRIPRGQGIVGLCAQEKKSVVVNDALNDPRIYRRADEISQNITRNLMAAPLLVDQECIGVLEVINTIDRSSFTRSDLEIFESFSDSVAIAVQRRTLLDDLQRTNLELERKLRETSALHAAAAAMMGSSAEGDLFRRTLESVRESMNIQRLSILLKDESSGLLRLAVNIGSFSQAEPVQPGLAQRVFDSCRPLFLEDINGNIELRELGAPGRYRSATCILLPMIGSLRSEPYGVFCAADPALGIFLEDDFQLLSTIVAQMVGGYENQLLNQQIAAQRAMEQEVAITSRIQRNILPGAFPQHALVELAGRSEMARTTGGDFFDFHVHEPHGAVTVLVADVSGKSLPAALFMAISSSILRTIIRAESDPVQILARANDLLYEESQSGMFVTVFLARYEPHANRLRYASAGHNEMLLLRANGEVELLSGRGHPLGVRASHMQRYTGGESHVAPGDMLALYTDGVIEAVRSDSHEEYGMDRYLTALRKLQDRAPAEIIDSIYGEVQRFSGEGLQSDDFTMLVARFFGTPAGLQDYNLHFPATRSSVPELRDQLGRICLRHGISGDLLDDILLVSDEAATNIVVHAYGDLAEGVSEFECHLQIESNHILKMNFRDSGRPFETDLVQEPDVRENLSGRRKGGFGVYLIRSLMDQVRYERKDGENLLAMEKDIHRP